MSKASIAILLHQGDLYPKRKHSMIWFIAKVWEDMGFEVKIFKGVPSTKFQADLWIPHIDMSITPSEYVSFLARQTKVLNSGIYDITKKKFSSNLLSMGDDYPHEVIVKTNKNYGGLPEYRKTNWNRLKWQWNKRVSKKYLNLGKTHLLHPHSYPVFPTLDKVPSEVWDNPNLIVEKFIPERKGNLYSIRSCLLFGQMYRSTRLYSVNPIIKGRSVVDTERIQTDPGVKNFCKNIGVEYAKLEYVIHDDRVCVLDLNKTPGLLADNTINQRIGNKLAQGIRDFLQL